MAEGYRVIGFDVEQHVYGEHRYPAQLVLQDVCTLHGKQFKDAAVIVASSPCQRYSYMAMPWTRAKEQAKWYRDPLHPERLDELNLLFNQPRRIQLEACEAAGRYIPLIQENVRGAIPWVGRSQWNFGSYHLWGDVPAMMPIALKAVKVTTMGKGWYHPSDPRHVPGLGFNTHADRETRALGDGQKNPGFRFDGSGRSFQTASVEGTKTVGHANQRDGHSHTRHLMNQAESEAVKCGGDWFGSGADCSLQRRAGSKSSARKAASARIAKIPYPLAQYIAHIYRPAA